MRLDIVSAARIGLDRTRFLAYQTDPFFEEQDMRITSSAISLNVGDVSTSATFVQQHFGFQEDMSAEGFVSLSRPDVDFNLIFLKTGLETFKPTHMRGHPADGVLIVFVVDNIDEEYDRLQAEGVTILTAIETESWGERYFQVADQNGVVIQLVQWMTEASFSTEF